MKVLYLVAACIVAGLAGNLAHAQNATLIRDADLKLKPFTDAPTVTKLPKKAALSILGNQGGWTQVQDTKNGHTGWVRLLNIRPDSQGGSASGFLSSLTTLGNVSRTGTTGAVATTGTKGISKDVLSRAAPNASERKRLEQYKASTKSAQSYARNNKLQSRDLAWLKPADATPAPATLQQTTNSGMTTQGRNIAPKGSVRVRGN